MAAKRNFEIIFETFSGIFTCGNQTEMNHRVDVLPGRSMNHCARHCYTDMNPITPTGDRRQLATAYDRARADRRELDL